MSRPLTFAVDRVNSSEVQDKDEWTVKQAPSLNKPSQSGRANRSNKSATATNVAGENESSTVTLSSLRRLLLRLIATDSVSIHDVPHSMATPFLRYTDFLACYVAQLSFRQASVSAQTPFPSSSRSSPGPSPGHESVYI